MNKKFFCILAALFSVVVVIVLAEFFLESQESKGGEENRKNDYAPFHVVVEIEDVGDEIFTGKVLEDNKHYKEGDSVKIKYSKDIMVDVRKTDVEKDMQVNVIYFEKLNKDGCIQCDGAPEILE